MGLSIDDKDPVFNDLKQVLMEVDRENKKQAAEVISELEKLDSILPRK